MANIIICEPSLSDNAALYGIGSAKTETPATNMQKMQPKIIWETTGVTTGLTVFSVDLGTSPSYDTFSLLFTNATTAATWTISTSIFPSSGFSDILTGATLRAAGQTNHTRPHAFYKHGSTLTNRYVKIQITDTSNPAGYIRVGRLYICKAYQPTRNADFGLSFGFEDLASEGVITLTGETLYRREDPIPTLNFSMRAYGTAGWTEVQANLFELFRLRGGSRDIMIVVDPADSSYVGRLIHYGTLKSRLAIQAPQYGVYQTDYQLVGLI